MYKKISLAALALAAVLFGGCINVDRFDYGGTQGPMLRFADSGINHKSVAVLPFLDQRGIKYVNPSMQADAYDFPYGDTGSFWFGIIPLMPFGWVGKSNPEGSDTFATLGRFHFDPSDDLAAAAQTSLAYSNIFDKVVRATSAANATADYLWQGSFSNLQYDGTLFSYCLMYIGSPVFWILGAPLGYSRNELWVEFALIERESGRTVWSYKYRGKDYIVHWIYARIGKDVSLYPQLMKQAMNAALYDLSQKRPSL